MHTKLATAIKNAMKQPKRLYLKKEKRMLEMKEIKRVIVLDRHGIVSILAQLARCVQPFVFNQLRLVWRYFCVIQREY